MRRAFRGAVIVSTAVAIVACSSFGGDDEPVAPAPSPDGSIATDGSSSALDGAAPEAGEASDGGLCPFGLGPAMVVVQASSTRSICVDVAEVSSAAYATFRTTLTDVTPLQPRVPEGCEMLAAAALDPADDAGALPRRYVSFCSAAFYCAAQGKRLCGSLADGGGVAITYDGGGGPPVEPPLEWEAACTGGKSGSFYPWGTTDPEPASAAGCLTATTTPDAATPRAVATTPVCGPSNGPYDMIGNVWEWVNLRVDEPGFNVSYTGVRGGAWNATTVSNGCATPHGMDGPLGGRATGRFDVGFRCCADPKP